MYITGITLPIAFIYGLHWKHPCLSSLAGYGLITECANTGNTGMNKNCGFITVKIMVLLFNHYIWQFGYSCTIFIISGLQIMCAMTLQSYLRMFWTVYKSNCYSVYKTGLMYRHLQVLARIMNIVQQGVHMTVLIVAAVIIQAVSSTILVRIPVTLRNVPNILVFSIILVDATLACVVCLGGLAAVHSESEKVYQKMKAKEVNGHSIWQHRFLKSCQLIKIRFGSFNYVDRETPLNCINMANALTVQLLLLGL